ncbi:MAG TPA: response regulator transcription factor [Gaiellales bacterium]|nr:response regulator transcription factor [Gaiellales bacterium]
MTTAPGSVLVVDDEPVVRDVLGRYFAREGFAVLEAADGEKALATIREQAPHAVVLDLMLPRLSGLDVLKLVRLETDVPVVILSARASEAERIAGLRLGADDYVVKPYSPREVVERVRAVLRRSAGRPGIRTTQFGDVEVDGERREVRRGGVAVHTTRKEFELLQLLAGSPGRTFSRSELLEEVWGYSWPGHGDTVTVHVRRVREKIEPDPSRPRHLVTVRGVGYRFDP